MGRKLGHSRYKILKRVSMAEAPLMPFETVLEQAIRTFYVHRQEMLSQQEKQECPPKVKPSGKRSTRSSAMRGS